MSSHVSNFGINLGGAFAQFTTGVGGPLNTDANNGLTPEASRAGTPGVLESFQRVSSVGKTQTTTTTPVVQAVSAPVPKLQTSSWLDEEVEADDGWGLTTVEETKLKTMAPKTMAPKVTKLATENKTKPKKGLQLKPKSKLKLEVEDDHEGWGDGW